MLAIGYLSRRDYSRQELRGRLMAAARARCDWASPAAPAALADTPREPARQFDESEAAREIDSLLDGLEAHGYLSNARFVESRINARAVRHGNLRIRQELARHGLELDPEQAAALRETEFARAKAVWERKFGEPAGEPRARAAQARFLAGRGFSADVVRRVIGGEDEP
jgi:regulatory protein